MRGSIQWFPGPDNRMMVSGHQLHAALGCDMPYQRWFIMQLLGGYEEGKDYFINDQYHRLAMGDGVTRHEVDHLMTISMARSVCAHQQTEKGRFYRRLLRLVSCENETKQELMTFALQSLYAQAVEANVKSDRLEKENAELQRQLSDAQNKLIFCEWVIDHPEVMAITRIADLYGMTPNQMNCWLEDHRVQHRVGKSWFLLDDYAGMGFTRSESHTKRDSSGKVWPQIRQNWTQKGRMFIYGLMKEAGFLPRRVRMEEDSEDV